MVEYSIRKQSLVFSLIGAMLFVALGILFVTGVISAEEGAAEIDRIGGIVIGWVVIIFFGGLSVFAIISILKSGNGPVILIDELGFFDRRVCTKPIPWSEIRSAHIFRGKTLYAIPMRFISLDVIDPDLYLKKGIDRYFPRLFKLFKKLYDEPGITIHTALFNQSPDEILSAIERESKGSVSID